MHTLEKACSTNSPRAGYGSQYIFPFIGFNFVIYPKKYAELYAEFMAINDKNGCSTVV